MIDDCPPLANSECRNCFLVIRDPAAASPFPSNNNNEKKFYADNKEEREKRENDKENWAVKLLEAGKSCPVVIKE